MEIIDSKKAYKAPKAKVVEVNVQGMLCQTSLTSNGINDMTVDEEDGGESFN